ncbi:hypothetical protein [Winogradskyella sp. PG-2]|uniref:hypothetical protein n=1 Tax=Winogradskyella sp. PG-2 TaxID=754409 RepID=UPI0005EF4D6F|nr:hypothetical protein [Winogradskyella sp. PG-2]
MKINFKEIAIFIYLIALIVPSFKGASGLYGFFALILGWIGIADFNVFIAFPWFANILFFIVLIFYKMKWKYKLTLTILAIIFGLFTFGIQKIPADESVGYYTVSVGLGFLFWMFSFLLLLISIIRDKLISPNNQNALHL